MTTIADTARPKLSPGVKLQFDRTRSQWILQAPERIFVLDEIAYEILQRCTGKTSISELILELSVTFEADATEIEADVRELLGNLTEKRVVIT
ncbi:MAG: pyrroloquinoline quinone biosynthesis peptide chaperone PqqD [Dongiaceae bacterium]